jgi:hypothetical protein
MEVAGLVVGGVALAGLYSACVEAVEHVESYRNLEVDAQQLSTRFKASKVILQRWAARVGLLNGRLSDDHDPRLEDPGIAEAICDVFFCLRKIMVTNNAVESRYNSKSGDSVLELTQARQASTSANALIPSRRQDKIAWVFSGRRKFATQLEIFETLVEKLQSLVPEDQSHMAPGPCQQLGGAGILGMSRVRSWPGIC